MSSWVIYVHTEESQAHDTDCAEIFQMNNGSLYISESDHELD